MYMSIFNNETLNWKKYIPHKLSAVGLILTDPKLPVKECIITKTATIVPVQLPDMETKYYCMIKALHTILPQLIRGDVLNIHSNFSRFPGEVGGKYDIRLEELYKRITDRGVTINKSLMELDNVTIELAYDSIVLYFNGRSYINIPCIRCKGVLIKRHQVSMHKTFLGCSEYPLCRKIIDVGKRKKPVKR